MLPHWIRRLFPASGNGGAIDNHGNTGIGGSTFSANTAGLAGGAIENTYQTTVSAANVGGFTSCVFTGNTAVTEGGAIDSSDGGQGQLNAYNSNFYGNTAPNGGAISTNDPTSLSADIFGSQSQPNSATSSGGNGGAVYAVLAPNAMSEMLSVTNCTFAYNQAAGTGSGGAVYTSMSTDVEEGTFDSNSVPNGGGGAIEADAAVGGMPGMPQTLTVNNATFKNQTVNGGNGGAINTSNPATLNNDTFTSNQVVAAGGNGGNGGAVYAVEVMNASTTQSSYDSTQLNVVNCTMDYNQATDTGDGGAIYATIDTDIEGGEYNNDSAGGDGGAIASVSPAGPAASASGDVGQLSPASSSTADAALAAPQGPIIEGPVLKVNNANLSANNAGGRGGAIYNRGRLGVGSLTVTNSTFLNSSAQTGGGIWTNNTATITNDTFGAKGSPNHASASGGAIYADNSPGQGANLNVSTCTFAYNTADGPGGAISSFVYTQVTNSVFSNNTAGFVGGALFYSNTQGGGTESTNILDLKLSNDYFTNNKGTIGGAVYSITNGFLNGDNATIVSNCTFDSNQAVALGKGQGGALYVEADTLNGLASEAGYETLVKTTLTNDTFFNNSSDNHGGAVALVLNDDSGNSLLNYASLTSLTFTGNKAATDSGGLYVNSNIPQAVTVINSILSGNTVSAAGYKGPVDFTMTNNNVLGNPLVDLGWNLVGTSDTMFTAGTNPPATDNPQLAAALANNGGPQVGSNVGGSTPITLPTLAPNAGSPAIGNGAPTNDSGMTAQTDERGKQRPATKTSIGAEDPNAM